MADDIGLRGTVSVLELILRIINHSIDFFFSFNVLLRISFLRSVV